MANTSKDATSMLTLKVLNFFEKTLDTKGFFLNLKSS